MKKLALVFVLFFLIPNVSYGETEVPKDLTEELRLLMSKGNSENVSKNDVERILEKFEEQGLTREELSQQILEMKEDKIKLLEGNITWILGIAALLLVLFGTVFTIISFVWKSGIKREFDTKISDIQTIGTQVEKDRKKVENDAFKIEENRQELKQLKRDFEENIILLKESKNKFEEKVNELNEMQIFYDFIEYKISEIEAVTTYNLLRMESIRICNRIRLYIEGELEIVNEQHVLIRFYKKVKPYVTADNETIADIFHYYEERLQNHEDDISKKILKELDFKKYIILTDGGETEVESDLIASIEEWKGYLNVIRLILTSIEVEKNLNSK